MMNFEDFENQQLVQRIFIYRSNFRIQQMNRQWKSRRAGEAKGWLDLDGTNEVLNEGCLYGVSEG